MAVRLFAPLVVAGATVAKNEKMLSFGVTSPLVASSKNGCVAAPPIEVRLPLTVSPLLAGFAPGVTATVSSVVLPAVTVLGLAAPTPAGLVELLHGFSVVAVLR